MLIVSTIIIVGLCCLKVDTGLENKFILSFILIFHYIIILFLMSIQISHAQKCVAPLTGLPRVALVNVRLS